MIVCKAFTTKKTSSLPMSLAKSQQISGRKQSFGTQFEFLVWACQGDYKFQSQVVKDYFISKSKIKALKHRHQNVMPFTIFKYSHHLTHHKKLYASGPGKAPSKHTVSEGRNILFFLQMSLARLKENCDLVSRTCESYLFICRNT